MDENEIKKIVKENYSRLASENKSCCSCSCSCSSDSNNLDSEQISKKHWLFR
ncbi:MAG: hypothetical protein ACOC1P_03490 [Minisyncoccales bacterium]